MRILKYLVSLFTPVFLIALFASLLTTYPYLALHEGLHAEHDEVDFDYSYFNRNITAYMNYLSDDLEFGAYPGDEEPVMNENEILHMQDVRTVYTGIRVLGLAGALIVAASLTLMARKTPRLLYETLRDIYYVPLFFTLFVGAWMVVDFGSFFHYFHVLLFDLPFDDPAPWTCGPDDVMCRFVPGSFWFISGLIVLALLAASIVAIMWVNQRYIKPRILAKEDTNGKIEETGP